MYTGWLTRDGNTYYLWPYSDGFMGRMVTGEQEIEGRRYRFDTTPGSTEGRLLD